MKTRLILILTILAFLSCKTTNGRKNTQIKTPDADVPQQDSESSPAPPSNSPSTSAPLDPNTDNSPQIPAPTQEKTIKLRFSFQAKDGTAAKPVPIRFTIPNPTGSAAWNSEATMIYAELGQELSILNNDSIVHRLHTDGKPCALGSDFNPGETSNCRLQSLYDPRIDAPLYDHNFNSDSRFWLRVLPSLKKTLENRCIGCHSGARPEGGLDLLSWPPKSTSASLATSIQQRLAADTPVGKRMPLGGTLSEPERTVLLNWVALNLPRPTESLEALPTQRSIRWMVLRNNKKVQEGTIAAGGSEVSYPRDLTRVLIRLEELIGGTWKLLKEQEIVTNTDATILIPLRSPGVSFPIGLGIDGIFQFVQDSQIKTVEDFILAMPEPYKRNYALVSDTKSRHLSDLNHPRLVNYSDSGRMFLGFSSHPDDPLRENVEMAEALEDGTWKFREINFRQNQATLSMDDVPCKVCHTSQPRPIWGSYPNWPGVLGNEGGTVSAAEFEAIQKLPSSPTAKDRFASLSFSLRKEYLAFYLPKRSYAYPNTIMNMVLGRRASYQLYRRMSPNPNFTKLLIHRLGEAECNDWPSNAELAAGWRALLLPSDIAMDLTSKETISESDSHWNQSSADLVDFVLYWGLLDLIHSNQDIAAIFQPILARMEVYGQLMSASNIETTVDAPYSDFRPHQYLYPRVLGDRDGKPVTNPEGPSLSLRRAEFCTILAL